ncbi:glycosyltransferase [Microbacterium ureisolvens]|uniref:glycosyltransferase n=1 Tax=Microbacterium ureisolvens TaxID=2781186 RepID=UPI00363CE9AC
MTGVHRVLDGVRRARAERHRRPPKIRFGEADTPARILYLSPDPKGPRGGVRVIYRHVDVLNAAGLDAAVVHHGRGYRAGWFENQTRTLPAEDVVVTPRDVLVVPEFYGRAIAEWPEGPTVVLFNQGPYYTFDNLSVTDARALNSGRAQAILTVSEDSLELLRFAFDRIPVHHARSVIEAATFHPDRDLDPGSRRRIAYAANRRAQERSQLLSILQLRGRVGWEFVPIHGMSEGEVARTLRSSAIFLAFNEREGFGLPPAEAMACGAYVIGYDGHGGKEFFDPAYSHPVADGDLRSFADAVERAVSRYEADPHALTAEGLTASEAILSRYTLDGLRSDLLGFYGSLRPDIGR